MGGWWLGGFALCSVTVVQPLRWERMVRMRAPVHLFEAAWLQLQQSWATSFWCKLAFEMTVCGASHALTGSLVWCGGVLLMLRQDSSGRCF